MILKNPTKRGDVGTGLGRSKKDLVFEVFLDLLKITHTKKVSYRFPTWIKHQHLKTPVDLHLGNPSNDVSIMKLWQTQAILSVSNPQ